MRTGCCVGLSRAVGQVAVSDVSLYICSVPSAVEVPSAESPELSKILSLKPGVGQNIALHASPTAMTFYFSYFYFMGSFDLILFPTVSWTSWLFKQTWITHTRTHARTHARTHTHTHTHTANKTQNEHLQNKTFQNLSNEFYCIPDIDTCFASVICF